MQQQKLSPQQIQMIKLLELPTVMLEQRIKEEIEENIVLEESEPSESDGEPQQISVEEYLREDDTPSYKMRLNHYSKDDQPRNIQISGGRSLQESLVEQLGFKNLSEKDMQLAIFLIGSIDGDGYLRRELDSLSDDIAFSLGIEASQEELERLLVIIQHLETECFQFTDQFIRRFTDARFVRINRTNLNLPRRDRHGPDRTIIIVRILNDRCHRSADTDSVTSHDHRMTFSIFVKISTIH